MCNITNDAWAPRLFGRFKQPLIINAVSFHLGGDWLTVHATTLAHCFSFVFTVCGSSPIQIILLVQLNDKFSVVYIYIYIGLYILVLYNVEGLVSPSESEDDDLLETASL